MITNSPDALLVLHYSAVLQETITQPFLDGFSLVEGGKYAVGFCVFQKAFRGCPKEREGKNHQVVFKQYSREPRGSLEVLQGQAPRDQEKDHARAVSRGVLLPTLSVSLVSLSLNDCTAQTTFETPFTRGEEGKTLSGPHSPQRAC